MILTFRPAPPAGGRSQQSLCLLRYASALRSSLLGAPSAPPFFCASLCFAHKKKRGGLGSPALLLSSFVACLVGFASAAPPPSRGSRPKGCDTLSHPPSLWAGVLIKPARGTTPSRWGNYPPSRPAGDAPERLWTHPNRCEEWLITPPNRCEECLITPPAEPLWTHTNRCEKNAKLPPHRSAFAFAPLRSAFAHSLFVLLTPHASYLPSRYSPLWPYLDPLTVFLVPLRSVCTSVIAQC